MDNLTFPAFKLPVTMQQTSKNPAVNSSTPQQVPNKIVPTEKKTNKVLVGSLISATVISLAGVLVLMKQKSTLKQLLKISEEEANEISKLAKKTIKEQKEMYTNKLQQFQSEVETSLNNIKNEFTKEVKEHFKWGVIIGETRTPKDLKEIGSLLETHNELYEKAVIKKTGKIGNPDNIEPIKRFLDHSNPKIQQEAVTTVCKIGKQEDIDSLIKPLLQEQDYELLENTLIGIGNSSRSELVELIVPLLKERENSKDYELIGDTISYTVRKIGKPEQVKLIAPLLQDANPKIKGFAIQAIEGIGTADHVALISPFLKDPDDNLVFNAIHAIGKIGNPEHAELLKPLLNNNISDIRKSLIEYEIEQLQSKGK